MRRWFQYEEDSEAHWRTGRRIWLRCSYFLCQYKAPSVRHLIEHHERVHILNFVRLEMVKVQTGVWDLERHPMERHFYWDYQSTWTVKPSPDAP